MVGIPAVCIHFGNSGKDNCELEPRIPKFLIAFGVVTIVFFIVSFSLLSIGLCVGCSIYRRNEKIINDRREGVDNSGKTIKDPRIVVDGFLITFILVVLLYLLFIVELVNFKIITHNYELHSNKMRTI